MKVIRVTKEWQKAGVYYVRTAAMVLRFQLSLESWPKSSGSLPYRLHGGRALVQQASGQQKTGSGRWAITKLSLPAGKKQKDFTESLAI